MPTAPKFNEAAEGGSQHPLVVPLQEFNPGDLVTITNAIFQPWMWIGIECRLIEKLESGQWKMETTSKMSAPHVCYFAEDYFRHR